MAGDAIFLGSNPVGLVHGFSRGVRHPLDQASPKGDSIFTGKPFASGATKDFRTSPFSHLEMSVLQLTARFKTEKRRLQLFQLVYPWLQRVECKVDRSPVFITGRAPAPIAILARICYLLFNISYLSSVTSALACLEKSGSNSLGSQRE
jgi:hypothetical protein